MFKKAERKQVKAKIALTGVSGSGKTWSALLIGRGLIGNEGKLALIDTENESASLYADLTPFDTLTIKPPFEIEKYTEAINEAVKCGYDCLVIDSLSHGWKQILEDKAVHDLKGGNTFTSWGKFTPKQEAFVNAILQSPIHILGTMRSKTDYVLELNDKGKQTPRKVGLAPIQRDGMEYEFTVVFDLTAPNHICEVSKDRTGLFDGKVFLPSIKTGEQIREWLLSAKAIETPNSPQISNTIPSLVLGGQEPEKAKIESISDVDKAISSVESVFGIKPDIVPGLNDKISEAQVKRLQSIRSARNIPVTKMKEYLKFIGYESSKDILQKDYDRIVNEIEGM